MTPHEQRLLAVIEIGTTSIRMLIAQQMRAGRVQVLDQLQHAVSLGRDTLTTGMISPQATERCVSALRDFRRVIAEYALQEQDIRVVATSAVREAVNRNTFLDRIFVATGFDVQTIDQAEVSRLTYRAVQPQLRGQPYFRKSDVLVVEVGGGSTETLLFRKGKATANHLYRLGSLRLRTLLEDEDATRANIESLMRGEVSQTLAQMQHNLKPLSAPRIILLGADARFACTTLCETWDRRLPCELDMAQLKAFMRSSVIATVDAVAKKHRLTYIEAETLGPALFIYVAMAEALKLKHLLVSQATLRDGILSELTTGEKWTPEFRRQVINSATAIGRKYAVNLRHAGRVASYGLQIIRTLRARYAFSERDEVIYHVAALLHEIGQAINTANHHKHSFYLVLNSDIFGLGQRDVRLAALVARYHRRAVPKPSHPDYMALDRTDRITVTKLASVIRVANALDRLYPAHPLTLNMRLEENLFVIETSADADFTLLRRRVRDRSDLFTSTYGSEIDLRARKA